MFKVRVYCFDYKSLFADISAFGIGKMYSGCLGAIAGAVPFEGIVSRFLNRSLDLRPSPKNSILLSTNIVFTSASDVAVAAAGKTYVGSERLRTAVRYFIPVARSPIFAA